MPTEAITGTGRGCYSPECAELEFSEVRIHGVLRSSRPVIATWHTKIVHMGDVPPHSGLPHFDRH